MGLFNEVVAKNGKSHKVRKTGAEWMIEPIDDSDQSWEAFHVLIEELQRTASENYRIKPHEQHMRPLSVRAKVYDHARIWRIE